MPIYEYECTHCHAVFEILRLRPVYTAHQVKRCPYCGGLGKHIMSSTFFRLKGEGWADTGYSKKPKENHNVID